MIYHGHIENGRVLLDVPVALPNGAQVSVQIEEQLDQVEQAARVRAYFGSISSGNARSADNVRIDDDLTQSITEEQDCFKLTQRDSRLVNELLGHPPAAIAKLRKAARDMPKRTTQSSDEGWEDD
jgi:hypothetical protein